MPNPNKKLSNAAQQRRRDIDNAKRRYRRQADRYEKEAATLSGKDRDIRMRAAGQLRERANELNGINVRKRFDKDTKALVNDSKNYLVSHNNSDWARGETLGKLRLSGSNLGNRFYALTESIWKGIPSTGAGDDRRLNAIRNEITRRMQADTPQMKRLRERYGLNPNANDLIAIVAELSGFDLDTETPYNLGDSDTVAMMRGAERILG